uniref:Uncharacterized protein n=1 Tax=Rhizophora mucronata TaxID=61149 RepID=A0A2P2QL75_RHIMU
MSMFTLDQCIFTISATRRERRFQ